MTFTETEVTKKGAPARQSSSNKLAKAKQQQQRKQQATNPDAQDLTDEHALLLKQKGDRFYHMKAYRPALNAYDSAVERDPFNAACFANRAACYMQLSRQGGASSRDWLKRCVADCDQAMEHATEDSLVGRGPCLGLQVVLMQSCRGGRFSLVGRRRARRWVSSVLPPRI